MSEMELYKKYRPASFKDMVGQESAVKTLMELGKKKAIPHALLFTGGPGTGKTTTARILREKLGCSDNDFYEYNSANFRGIDTIREITMRAGLAPMGGRCKIYLTDEVHQLTPQAQEAMLKLLEDTPAHVYFILCTTDPQKLKKALRSRCTEISFKQLGRKDAEKLLKKVSQEEGIELTDAVIERIVDQGEGSPRNLLVLLDKIRGSEGEENQLNRLEAAELDGSEEAYELAKLLMNTNNFGEIAALLQKLKEDPESTRYTVLGFARGALLKTSRKNRAYAIIQAFRDNFYDSKAAGLAAACYEALSE